MIGISITEKTVSAHVKNCYKFSRAFENADKLLTRHSLYLAPWTNINVFSFWNVNKLIFILLVARGWRPWVLEILFHGLEESIIIKR